MTSATLPRHKANETKDLREAGIPHNSTEALKDNVKKHYDRGFSFTPLDGKVPVKKGWQKAPRASLEDTLKWIDKGRNIGLRTGKASGSEKKRLVVIDQDKGGDIAALKLPDTVTAGTGSGGCHYYFYTDEPIKNSAGKLSKNIDVRGEGGQVVYPGSIHPVTEQEYKWIPYHSPDDVKIAWLPYEIIKKLQGDKPKQKPKAKKDPKVKIKPATDESSQRYALAGLRNECQNIIDAEEGGRNDQLNTSAFKVGTLCGSGALDTTTAREELTKAAMVTGMTSSEIATTIKSGLEDGIEKPRKEKSNDNIIEYPEPMRLAEHYLDNNWRNNGYLLLRRYRENFYGFDETKYSLLHPESIDAKLYVHLDKLWTPVRKQGETVINEETEEEELRKIEATISTVRETRSAIPSLGTLIDDRHEAPFWLDGRTDPDPLQLLVCQNGLLDIKTRKITPATPDFFTFNGLGVTYDPTAPQPSELLKFLKSLWPEDPDSINMLQEWFGYLLTPDTRQQKMLLLVGPKRSGKGTIGRVLAQLLGQENIAGPTLSGLTQNFGLQPLLDKQLAIISDARLSGRADQAAVVERLLAISGEDNLTVDCKYKTPITVKLKVRFVLLTNELPRLSDSSGALTSRFNVLKLTKSFYGEEDHGLTDRLLQELPGILNWAIEGWHRLEDRGYFVQPQSAQEVVTELEALGSPINTFIKDWCIVEPGASVEVGVLFEAWKVWCESQGRDHPGNVQSFGRDLRAAVPGLKTSRSRSDEGRARYYEGIGLRYK